MVLHDVLLRSPAFSSVMLRIVQPHVMLDTFSGISSLRFYQIRTVILIRIRESENIGLQRVLTLEF